MPPKADDFRKRLRKRLRELLKRAEDEGKPHVDVSARKLHRDVGGYPGHPNGDHRMPSCCGVMRAEMVGQGDRILPGGPPKGDGPSLTIRYELPRRPSS